MDNVIDELETIEGLLDCMRARVDYKMTHVDMKYFIAYHDKCMSKLQNAKTRIRLKESKKCMM